MSNFTWSWEVTNQAAATVRIPGKTTNFPLTLKNAVSLSANAPDGACNNVTAVWNLAGTAVLVPKGQ